MLLTVLHPPQAVVAARSDARKYMEKGVASLEPKKPKAAPKGTVRIVAPRPIDDDGGGGDESGTEGCSSGNGSSSEASVNNSNAESDEEEYQEERNYGRGP